MWHRSFHLRKCSLILFSFYKTLIQNDSYRYHIVTRSCTVVVHDAALPRFFVGSYDILFRRTTGILELWPILPNNKRIFRCHTKKKNSKYFDSKTFSDVSCGQSRGSLAAVHRRLLTLKQKRNYNKSAYELYQHCILSLSSAKTQSIKSQI